MLKILVFSSLFFLILLKMANAQIVGPIYLTPSTLFPEDDFNIKALVWYDVSLEPVSGATVYYSIESIGVNCTLVNYPSNQTLVEVQTGVYCSGLGCNVEAEDPDAPFVPGLYTVCVKAEKEGFKPGYGAAVLNVTPDTPIFTKFLYSGDLNYFNVFWNIRFTSGRTKEVTIECYLNDVQKCIPFPFKQKPNSGTCSVVRPNYNYGNSPQGTPNKISCFAHDSRNIYNSVWKNSTFSPIAFEIFVSPATVTVGQSFPLQINTKNNGLLTDNYTVSIEVAPAHKQFVSIEQNESKIINVKTGEVGSGYARLTVLASVTSITITSRSKSEISGIVASQDIIIKSGAHSMPEFDFYSLIQIILISSLILKFKNKLL